MTNKPVFRGCATALVTPFKNGGVNYAELRRLIEFQIQNGADALVICGTTGEAPTLSDDEHLSSIRLAVDCAAGRVPVIAGTGSNNTAHAVYMSRQAEKLGADALLCVTPYYNKCTDEGLVKSYTEIMDSVSLPVIIYNVPSRTSVNISANVCRELFGHENFGGIKEASSDVAKIAAIRSLCGNIPIYSGCDDLIVPVMSMGGAGVISVLSNLIPGEVKNMCELCEKGEYGAAAGMQTLYYPLIHQLFSRVNPIPVKAAMAQIGFDTAEIRLPLCTPDKAFINQLRQTMCDVGFVLNK